jgi:HAE1 family hydrophobic/amphiphilic exporter-1
MLGDNAVIVVENIRRSAERGLPVRRAVLEGAARVGVPAAVSTATNVAVFLPVLTLDGVGRQLFGQMAVAMTVSLLVSLLVATTLVPVLVDRLPWTGGIRTGSAPSDPQIRWLTNLLGWAIRRRVVVVAIAGSAMGAGMLYAAFLPTGGTPVMDDTSLTVTMDFPPATPQNDLLHHVRSFERRLLTLTGVQWLRLESGTLEESDSWAAEGSSSTRVVASIESDAGADIRPLQDRIRSWTRIMEGQVAGLRTAVGPRATPFDRLLEFGSRGIAIRFTGLQEGDWSRRSQELLDAVASVRGIADIAHSGTSSIDEKVILPDAESAAQHGVPLHRVEAAIASFQSDPFLLPHEGGYLPVRLSVGNDPSRSNAETILRGRISTDRRILVMGSLVHAGWRPNSADLCREDGRRVHLVTANAAGRAPADVVTDLATVLARVALPPGATVRVGVLSREASDSASSALLAVFLSVLLMYMILAAEYESLILPLIVLASSPLAFVGAVAALALWGEPLGILSLAGLIITVGAVDNDAVIALDLIAEKIRAGKDRSLAIVEGMLERLRPIVVTSLTTVLGVLPLLFQSGNGSVLVRSLAIPLAGGLVASTIATVAVIPSLIALAGDRLHLFPRAGPGRAG